MDYKVAERKRLNSWADALFEQAKAHQECYIAGMRAADESGPSARKLARLLSGLDEIIDYYGEYPGSVPRVIAAIRIAIAEARKP